MDFLADFSMKFKIRIANVVLVLISMVFAFGCASPPSDELIKETVKETLREDAIAKCGWYFLGGIVGGKIVSENIEILDRGKTYPGIQLSTGKKIKIFPN